MSLSSSTEFAGVVPALSHGQDGGARAIDPASLRPMVRLLCVFAAYFGCLELMDMLFRWDRLTMALLRFVPYCVLLVGVAPRGRALMLADKRAWLLVGFLLSVFLVLGLSVTRALPQLKEAPWIGSDSRVRGRISSLAMVVAVAAFPAASYLMFQEMSLSRAILDRKVARLEQAEQELRFQTMVLESQLEASLDAILTVDERRRMICCNRRFIELWALSHESVAGQSDERLLPDLARQVADPAAFVARIEELYRQKELRSLERVQLKDGRTLERYSAPVCGARGDYYGRTWLFRDISERLEAEAELRRLCEQTRQDAETKTDLLREVNHRVKNNLIGILGLVQAHQRFVSSSGDAGPVPPALSHLSLQVRGLIEVHHMLSETQWSPMYLADLAHRIITAVAGMVEPRHRIVLRVTPSEALVSPRQASSMALALNELATNTLKYAATGRTDTLVTVSIRAEGGFHCLEYRDDGPGFPAEILAGQRHGLGLVLLGQLAAGSFRGSLSLANDGGAVATLRIRPDEVTRT